MSQETTDNFWQVFGSFKWPDPVPVSHRLYHDDQGRPVIYSMEVLDMPYVEVDAETFAVADYQVKVKDGKIIKLVPKMQIKKLAVGDTGTSCHPDDVTVIVTTMPNVKWKIEINEQD